MKKYIKILIIFFITILISCSSNKYIEISYTEYEHYFVKNKFDFDTVIGNFFAMNDTTSFNKVFGAAVAMDTSVNWINPSDFNDNFIITVIKRYCMYKYDLKIKKVSGSDGIIKVDYDYYVIDEDAKYVGPGNLIIMIKKQAWDKINFYENDKFIKQIIEPFH